jgi:hypothetical protein
MQIVLMHPMPHPRVWAKRLGALPGPGTAYLTRTLGKDRQGYPGGRAGWTEGAPAYGQGETLEDWLTRQAAQGQDLLVRMSHTRGRARLFTRPHVHQEGGPDAPPPGQ